MCPTGRCSDDGESSLSITARQLSNTRLSLSRSSSSSSFFFFLSFCIYIIVEFFSALCNLATVAYREKNSLTLAYPPPGHCHSDNVCISVQLIVWCIDHSWVSIFKSFPKSFNRNGGETAQRLS